MLPVGYNTGAAAYRNAVEKLTARELTTHYTSGLEFFHKQFVPELKTRLQRLTNGVWSFDDHVAYAAGSDVDFMTHIVEAIAARDRVTLFPGDWYGFLVGCSQQERIVWDASGQGTLACLCVPSVRNGHVTPDMLSFLKSSEACLLNLNLYPTLVDRDRELVARDLLPVFPKSILSISFSRGFGLTASQLGVVLVPNSHPLRERFDREWSWFTYFYNAVAARAFLEFDLNAAGQVDRSRAAWVHSWLEERGLPAVTSGSYYVKSFQVEGELPGRFDSLRRDDVVRLCFKPPQT